MTLYIDDVENVNKRIDIFIKDHSEFSRTYISSLIEDGYVSVNDVVIKKTSYKTKLNDKIIIVEKEIETIDLSPENIPLDILYEDDDILIINKERGVVVHPSNGHYSGTLVNAVLYHCKDNLSTINGVIRPGIVHRIDKDTSGILCICKNDFAHKNIANQFAMHSNVRKYHAIVRGSIDVPDGIIDLPIGRDKRNRLRMAIDKNGKPAKTYFKVIDRYMGYTYIECELYTGRTHQIRVHMKNLGYPLLGDLVYGKVDKNFKELSGQILHAFYLELNHPRTNKRMTWEIDNPLYFKDILGKITDINYEQKK